MNKLTLIVTFLNEGIGVRNTIESFRNSTKEPFDIILTNDGSTDKTSCISMLIRLFIKWLFDNGFTNKCNITYMKRLSLLLMLICLYTASIVGQDNYSQQQALAEMLFRNELFKARQQRQLCRDTIDKSLELCYAFKMHGFMNRPDSSALNLEAILKEYFLQRQIY